MQLINEAFGVQSSYDLCDIINLQVQSSMRKVSPNCENDKLNKMPEQHHSKFRRSRKKRKTLNPNKLRGNHEL